MKRYDLTEKTVLVLSKEELELMVWAVSWVNKYWDTDYLSDILCATAFTGLVTVAVNDDMTRLTGRPPRVTNDTPKPIDTQTIDE